MKIAVMQPAFIPPASYLRLFAACDVFVVLDDVQFDRRWYTHRQQLTGRTGNKQWLTLPLKKMPRDTTMICGLEWQDNARDRWVGRLKNFPVFDKESAMTVNTKNLFNLLSPVDCVSNGLFEAVMHLRIKSILDKSSRLNIAPELHGQDRIIAICKKLGATEYVNSPGGRELYDDDSFMKEGIKLTFLPDYKGSYDSVLERLQDETPKEIRQEIMENL